MSDNIEPVTVRSEHGDLDVDETFEAVWQTVFETLEVISNEVSNSTRDLATAGLIRKLAEDLESGQI